LDIFLGWYFHVFPTFVLNLFGWPWFLANIQFIESSVWVNWHHCMACLGRADVTLVTGFRSHIFCSVAALRLLAGQKRL
jgi:hypothetical protein